MNPERQNFSASEITPEEKVENLKKAIAEIGFKIEETAEGIRIFEAK